MSRLVIARFDEEERALAAWRALRERWPAELHSGAPIAGMHEAERRLQGRVNLAAGLAAVLGGAIALLVQWWTSARGYPIAIGGRGIGWPAFVPATIGVAMLWCGVGATIAFLRGARLPRLHQPIFEAESYARLAAGEVLLVLEPGDEGAEALAAELRGHRPDGVEILGDAD